MSLEAELDRLYSAPLAEFVATRNQIVKNLKEDGNDDDARQVATLRKPSFSAWVVNQLTRNCEVDVRRLIKTGERIAVAQTGSKADYEAARQEESEAVRILRRATKEMLPNVTGPTLDRVVASLRAGAATQEGRAMLLQGRLTEDLEPAGFGAFADLTIPPKVSSKAKATTTKAGPTKAGPKKLETLQRRLEAAKETARTLDSEASEIERQLKEAETIAAKLGKAAASARQRSQVAAGEVERIQEEIAKLQ